MTNPIAAAKEALDEALDDLAITQIDFDNGRTGDWCVGAAEERVERFRQRYNQLCNDADDHV